MNEPNRRRVSLFAVLALAALLVEPSQGGIVVTLAGDGAPAFSGDGGPSFLSQLFLPHGVALDATGALFISEVGNDVIRHVDTSGTITTVAGVAGSPGDTGDGGPALNAPVIDPTGLAIDSTGALYFSQTNNHRVRVIDPAGDIHGFAGDGQIGFLGDGGPALGARLAVPVGLAVRPGTDNLTYRRIVQRTCPRSIRNDRGDRHLDRQWFPIHFRRRRTRARRRRRPSQVVGVQRRR